MKNFPWLKKYPSSVSTEINPDQYSSVIDFLEECFKKYSTLPAFVCMGKEYSYAEMDELSKNFAAYLQGIGLKKGDRIAIMMPNVLQYPIALFGAIRAGLVIVNTNPLYTVREMKHQFKDSGADAIVILSNFAANLEKALPQTGIKHIVVTSLGDMLGGLKAPLVNFVVKNVKKMVPSYNLPSAVKFNKALSIGKGKSYTRPTVQNKELAFLQYTGGTTGVSKGAMLSHRNVISNMLQIREWMKPRLKEREELIITPLPLYHIFALTVNCLTMLSMGTKNVLIVNPRDMPAFVKELKKYPFTVMTGVNTLFNGLLNQEDFKSVDFSHFKMGVGGGMAVQKAVAERWKQVTGAPIVEGYGLSETAPVLTCNLIENNEQIGTIGIPVSSTEVKIIDENGNDLPLGEAGEICARGPQVMQGYWNRPDETEKVMNGEWFKTGDIGVQDEHGVFRIVDRKKDMILVSGFNVYPNEVEDEIAHHPGVLEVAAIGVPDEKSTEAVKVFIVKKDENLTAEEVRKYCKDCLTGYKVPKHVEFLDELPKTNVGKILRRSLKEREAAKNKQTTAPAS